MELDNMPQTHDRLPEAQPAVHEGSAQPVARVIVNADDWGGNRLATDRILDCIRHGSVSSTSAMVFMEDSERAAGLAREYGVDAGLHLNLTASFTAKNVPERLREKHGRIARYLGAGRYTRMIYHPLLAGALEYVVKAQLDEFARLYGRAPGHIDGHHHAHLCANVLRQELLPAGTLVRRNFTFAAGEKGWLNRAYRERQDARLKRRHRITGYFFSLPPIDEQRLRRMFELARIADVEIETHPERTAEYEFLMGDGLQRFGYQVTVARGYRMRGDVREETPAFAPAKTPHIAVCICTYKRPEPLKRLLRALDKQKTDGLFTYSAVVADNDASRSGEAAVEAVRGEIAVPVKYCVEPEQGIARARNRVVANAEGDYLAFIDDDEFPTEGWLLNLLETCRSHGVDGALGPVRRHLDEGAPQWLKRSALYDRAVHATGERVEWRGARTGNVLLKRELVAADAAPFDVRLAAGEDQDFFRRKMDEGRRFVWTADAVVYEELPPARWKRMYFVRKGLLHGANAAERPDCTGKTIVKSMMAVPLYTLALPFALLGGQHRFMTLLVKLCDHAGKLMQRAGIPVMGEQYISD